MRGKNEQRLVCDLCKKLPAFYVLYGEKLCDFCLISRKLDYCDPDWEQHISLPIKRIKQPISAR